MWLASRNISNDVTLIVAGSVECRTNSTQFCHPYVGRFEFTNQKSSIVKTILNNLSASTGSITEFIIFFFFFFVEQA